MDRWGFFSVEFNFLFNDYLDKGKNIVAVSGGTQLAFVPRSHEMTHSIAVLCTNANAKDIFIFYL